jgi:hypothetical protein
MAYIWHYAKHVLQYFPKYVLTKLIIYVYYYINNTQGKIMKKLTFFCFFIILIFSCEDNPNNIHYYKIEEGELFEGEWDYFMSHDPPLTGKEFYNIIHETPRIFSKKLIEDSDLFFYLADNVYNDTDTIRIIYDSLNDIGFYLWVYSSEELKYCYIER